MRRPILVLLSLLFTACVTPASLPPEERVHIAGGLESVNAEASVGREIKLDLPLLDQEITQSDEQGAYSFELSAARTQFAGTEARLEVSAEDAQGRRVQQAFQVGKTRVLLPTMRFWDGILAPAESLELSDAVPEIRWQAPEARTQNYTLRLFKQDQKYRYLSETIAGPSFQLNPAFLEPQSRYRWEVVAHLSDYDAVSAPRSFRTSSNWPHQSWPIEKIQTPQGLRPRWHDRQLQTDAELDYDLEPLNVTIRLKQKQRVTGLHVIASGFPAQLELRHGDSLLSTQSLNGDLLFALPPTETQELNLVLKPESGGFVRIRELRVLGER